MSRAVLSMGSNLGDRLGRLSAAVVSLGNAVQRVSAVYRSPPWGPVPQDEYYNIALIAVADHVDAYGWLARCRQLEQAAGRVRDIRWGPRTLDADVVAVDDVVSLDPDLTLPHPRAHERAFVLVPWSEIDPDAELSGFGPISTLLQKLDPATVAAVTKVGHVG